MSAPATSDSAPAEDPVFKYTDSFTTAGPRKRRKSRLRQERSPRVRLNQCADELRAENWFARCNQVLLDSLKELAFPVTPQNSPLEVLCLGLGTPALSRNARAQLAFLVQMCDTLCISRHRVAVYDPEFREADIDLMTGLELRCLTENKLANYPVNTHTIIFMPHCGDVLNENILRANWTRGQLSKVLFVGNTLRDYVDSKVTNKLRADFPCLLRLAPYLQVRPLPGSSAYEQAFYSIAVQYVSPETIATMGNDDMSFWEVQGDHGDSGSSHVVSD